MKNKYCVGILGILFGFAACTDPLNSSHDSKQAKQDNADEATIKQSVDIDTSHYEPQVSIVKYEQLLSEFTKNNDTLYVVNFWATWCLPCVKELPYFISTSQQMANQKMKLVLVSLDTKDNLERTVIPYLAKKKWRAMQFLLADNGRMNEWIAAVNKDWEGAIPATAFYKNGAQVYFSSGQLSHEELKTNINRFITQ